MRKYLPIVMSVVIVGGIFAAINYQKNQQQKTHGDETIVLGEFNRKQGCARAPRFLSDLKIKQPVIIDLSQKQFKGIAFHHGPGMDKVLHLKQWEQFEGLGTYTLDEEGNLYLAPMPYISISSDTFELQKNIYKLDSKTGNLAQFMHFDDVIPGQDNPYGVYTLVFDCEDKTLWVAAIDETDYQSQKGIIYHINPVTRQIIHRIEGFDAITLNILFSTTGKYLLAGSAKDSGLYAFKINDGSPPLTPVKLLELPDANDHIRKIKIKANNHLELQAIPFSYTLIAESSKKYRNIYDAFWNKTDLHWKLSKKN